MRRRSGPIPPVAIACAVAVFSTPACVPERGDRTERDNPAARRVVSLVPSTTEIVIALGASDRLVARTDADDDPELQHLPSVGLPLTPDIEVLRSVEPDLVIAWSGSDVDRLQRVVEWGGGRVRAVSVDRLTQVVPTIGDVGTWLGARAVADSLRTEVSRTLARARRVAGAGPVPRVLWVVWSEPIIVAGPETFLGDVIGVAGGVNVAPAQDVPWPRIGLEALVGLDPDVLVWPDGPGMFAASELRERPGWGLLRAVRQRRVLQVRADRFHVPGPGLARATLELAERLTATAAS